MGPESLRKKAEHLRALHTAGRLLVLPNVWDPIGARVLVRQGYPAVATASAAVSASLGYADGERLLRATMLEKVARIASSVDVPVTADMESGYADSLVELEETTRRVIAVGAAGLNIEDGTLEGGPLRDLDEQRERIACVRSTATAEGVPLVINARIDCFLSSSFPDAAAAMDECVRRAAAYVGAGADCVYPIGPGDESTVRTLRERIACPINILGSPGAASLSVLRTIGVNRVSFGPFLFRLLLRRFADLTAELRRLGPVRLDDMLTSREAAVYLRDTPEGPA